jgi:hypothetical protein
VRNGASLELLNQIKFIGETSNIERDSSNEYVRSSEGSGNDDGLEEETEAKTSCDKSTTHVDDPEKPFLLSCKHESGVYKKPANEPSKSCDTGSSQPLAFVQQESSQQANNNRPKYHNPSYPVFCIIS